MQKSSYEEFVQQLTGMPFEGMDEVTFAIDENLSLTISPENEDSVGLYSKVFQTDGDVPQWVSKEVCLANYGCAGTRGATLGIHSATGGVLLTRILPFASQVAPSALLTQALIFIETAQMWSRRLERRGGEAVSEPKEPVEETLPQFSRQFPPFRA